MFNQFNQIRLVILKILIDPFGLVGRGTYKRLAITYESLGLDENCTVRLFGGCVNVKPSTIPAVSKNPKYN